MMTEKKKRDNGIYHQLSPCDVVAFSPHPDDVELFCGGTIALLAQQGKRTAIVDLTRGELSSRGSVEKRRKEAEQARRALGVKHRINLSLPDGGIENRPGTRESVIEAIRAFQPRIVLLPYWSDRHPDHVRASHLVRESAFHAGLHRIESGHPPFRPDRLLYYMCHHPFEPTLVVDITGVQDIKMKAIGCYESQFDVDAIGAGPVTPLTGDSEKRVPGLSEPETYISTRFFMEQMISRSRYFGGLAGVEHGEPFFSESPPLVRDLMDLLPAADDRSTTP